MSTADINKCDNEDESKSLDKKQIEEEEKELMLKAEKDRVEPAAGDANTESGGPVKAALSGEITEQGREVKPKFIPIGAIKMPGFFTKNSDKSKDDEGNIEKDGDNDKGDESAHKPKRLHAFFHTFTQFLHHPRGENAENKNTILNMKLPKIFQKKSASTQEAALASMETLEEKLDTPDDGMENVKLEITETEEGKVATKLPLKERIRQKKFIMDDLVVCFLVVLVLLVVVIAIAVGSRAGPPKERPLRLGRFMTSVTSCGHVEGILDEGVFKFFSIPYAVPPIGEKRFTYAQPMNNISMCWNGTLEAHKQGPLCLQFLDNGNITGDENCLTLDIVTPHVRYDSPLPVVVLIGANSLSGGISPAQPSAMYSRTKEVVFVRPNFRLGPFGFLALDILSKSKYPATSGNYALSDLVVALQWIKYNIKHFGGDASSVTILGHRAGATLTAALTTMNKVHKLYTRAWLSSASVIFPGEPLEQSEKINEPFKQRSKCNDVECLRRISATEVLTAVPDTWFSASVDTLPQNDEPKHSWLVLDGELLRLHAYESWDAIKQAKESGKDKANRPIIFGTTEHSASSPGLKMKHLNWTSEIVEKMVNDSVLGQKNLTSAVFGHFNKSYDGLVRLISSIRTLCPLVSLARMRLSARLYVVTGAGAGEATINSDVEAILGTFDSETAEQRRFMSAMQQLFYYFVWHGQLVGPDTGLIAVGQDLLPLQGLPECDLLIREDIVPRYAHID